MRKIARQSKASVRAPPIAGPAAVPTSAAPSQSRRPERDAPASSTPNAASSPTAPPTACTARSASSTPSESAKPQPSEPAANSAIPQAPARGRFSRAANGSASVSTSA